MIFFAPLAYIGASYYNGENGIEKIKKLFQLDESGAQEQSSNQAELSKDDIIHMQQQEIDLLKKKIQELESRIATLESQ